MNKLNEAEQQHLQEQATLSVKVFQLEEELKTCKIRLNEVNVVINTLKFVANNPVEIPEKSDA